MTAHAAAVAAKEALPHVRGPYKRKPRCIRGHLLEGDNLQINTGKLGRPQRTCIACRLARDKARRTSAEERAKAVAYSKAWKAKNPGRAELHERKKALKVYGLTPADYEAMLAAQKGLCAVCGQTCKTGRRLAVDHDHETGKVRGLLCSNCNQGLGRFLHDPVLLALAIRYLA